MSRSGLALRAMCSPLAHQCTFMTMTSSSPAMIEPSMRQQILERSRDFERLASCSSSLARTVCSTVFSIAEERSY